MSAVVRYLLSVFSTVPSWSVTAFALILAAAAGGSVGWMLGVSHAHASLSERARGLLRAVWMFRDRYGKEVDRIVEKTPPSPPQVSVWDDFPTIVMLPDMMTCHDQWCPAANKHPCHESGCKEHMGAK